MKRAFLFLIRFYKISISSFFPSRCRFYPSCSSYAAEVLNRFGIRRGFILSLKRISRCHPFYPGGYDPVPEK
ncbi:MAG: membrane protein insertion efficiency factor YidD [bacterium (Candidatus Ratteibacteria) CG_4_10_14_3_um_filter_41_18]|uniref:Putative membrane protein insertion efficiency factor n=4 Tax=Candidatus Ratteibacteria TaxID=2979319 RepID=A0A2M7E893_9BACT|nr:MAG: membrane protein insertion efficiency factor YidD [Candidatus Omnitrophica bacterium CG1_02_41_171]PIV63967.1 MAG: membrane protein insertion efficiency factor YidD [bacterium (Candidatus Ratteibacteria) CG01_land_8_20_14_3_00_40_19]PIW33988.1 MAG: membrane protein insertion efficiency factor YidD [bacterium (Candidatus Ratteibacteria) CG15_BIG_FIL_POST_REV_8_21_14_020_41_12]PIW73757.1 MAG: membrane protein insertion efficiency factor YidD [bacterium (Candidatus Ratteibacteria) CG_4_8_14